MPRLLVHVVFISICLLSIQEAVATDEETEQMVHRLAAIDRNQDPRSNGYLSSQRVAMMKRSLSLDVSMGQQIEDRFLLAVEHVRANQNAEAIDLMEQIQAAIRHIPKGEIKPIRRRFNNLHALAWIRYGEQENCVQNHSSDSCLFPISGNGIHQLTRGSTQATKVLLDHLESDPDDQKARWLLNLASMTLGNYPEGVPPQFLIPPGAFDSDYSLQRFTDIAPIAGIAINSLAGGGVMTDFNNDGFLDLMVSSWSLQDQVHLLISKGDGTFENQTEQAGISGITGGLNMQYADYDNDGDSDVLILRGAWLFQAGRHPNSLLRNNGDGTFSDVTQSAGLLSFLPTQTATWADFNNDGWLDLFIGNESPQGLGGESVQGWLSTQQTSGVLYPCELYMNNKDGSFTNLASEAGLQIHAWVKGVASGDFDNDGWTDLYLSILGAPNKLFRNRGVDSAGQPSFEDVSLKAGVTEPVNSFPCWFWDYDNDGWEDLFVAGYQMDSIEAVTASYSGRESKIGTPRIYRNKGDGSFEDVSASAGLEQCWLPMGANFGDLDNDGFPDFYVATGEPGMDMILPNKMYRNDRGKTFQDVTTSGGFGHLQKGHAVSFGDFDNDGDQDVHTVMGGAFEGDRYMNALFENPGNDNHWLKLELVGTESNRSGIGARIHVSVQTPDGSRSIHKTVGTGGSFGGNPTRQELGLGNAETIESLTVYWPASQTRQVFRNVMPDHTYRIREDSESLERMQIPVFTTRKKSADTHHH
ncbi:MAG: FG-GAP-like repeat-containing protein [Puniceicoccaceae bacterium]